MMHTTQTHRPIYNVTRPTITPVAAAMIKARKDANVSSLVSDTYGLTGIDNARLVVDTWMGWLDKLPLTS